MFLYQSAAVRLYSGLWFKGDIFHTPSGRGAGAALAAAAVATARVSVCVAARGHATACRRADMGREKLTQLRLPRHITPRPAGPCFPSPAPFPPPSRCPRCGIACPHGRPAAWPATSPAVCERCVAVCFGSLPSLQRPVCCRCDASLGAVLSYYNCFDRAALCACCLINGPPPRADADYGCALLCDSRPRAPHRHRL